MRLPPRNRYGQFRRPRRRGRSRQGGFALGKLLPLVVIGGIAYLLLSKKKSAPALPAPATDTSAETQILMAQQAAQAT